MGKLWAERDSTAIPLLRALRTLLADWLAAAHASRDELTALVAAQRSLGIVADLDGHIVRLGAGVRADQAADAEALRAELRGIRAELTALSRL